jgi:NDP-sugar pyrophosphorylase family protein
MCQRAHVTNLCINLHHRGDQIRQVLGDGHRWNAHITYSHEPELLGTAGAVIPFRPQLEAGPFYVIYGDNFSQCDLLALWQSHRQAGATMTVAVHEREDVRTSGVVTMDDAGWITGFVEKPTGEVPPSHWVNAGIYVLEPSLLADIPSGPSDFARDHIPRWIAGGKRIFSHRLDGPVIAIDTPALLQWAQQTLGE